jgi:hypothetical protein
VAGHRSLPGGTGEPAGHERTLGEEEDHGRITDHTNPTPWTAFISGNSGSTRAALGISITISVMVSVMVSSVVRPMNSVSASP